VVSVDLQEIEYAMSNVRFVRGDINEVDVPRRDFDVIIACSVLEHIGLGGRFDSLDYRDGDLKAMKRLRQLLAPEGRLLVTVPVGVDAVVSPLHRIYGPKRLPRLLEPFCVAREEFWSKADGTHWQVCTREEALSTVGSARYYALGLFVLAAAKAGRPRVSEQCHCISGGPAVKQGF
jgi:SAM-dependent methyltransferase